MPIDDSAGGVSRAKLPIEAKGVVAVYRSASGLVNLVKPTFAVVAGGLAIGRVRMDGG